MVDFFILSTLDKHDKTQLLAKFQKILYMGFRATLNFRKFPVTVVMVTYCVTKMRTTCSPMIGQIFETMMVASSDKEWLQRPIQI